MMGDVPIVYCWVAVWYPVWEMVMVCGVVGEVVSLRKKVFGVYVWSLSGCGDLCTCGSGGDVCGDGGVVDGDG